jgi:hypothetical protein
MGLQHNLRAPHSKPKNGLPLFSAAFSRLLSCRHGGAIDVLFRVYGLCHRLRDSIRVSVYLFVCLFVCPCVYLSVYMSVYLSVSLFIYPCVYLSVRMFIYLFVCLCLAVCLSAELTAQDSADGGTVDGKSKFLYFLFILFQPLIIMYVAIIIRWLEPSILRLPDPIVN